MNFNYEPNVPFCNSPVENKRKEKCILGDLIKCALYMMTCCLSCVCYFSVMLAMA